VVFSLIPPLHLSLHRESFEREHLELLVRRQTGAKQYGGSSEN